MYVVVEILSVAVPETVMSACTRYGPEEKFTVFDGAIVRAEQVLFASGIETGEQ